jgi:Mrp family chromosome partitioning ATPase
VKSSIGRSDLDGRITEVSEAKKSLYHTLLYTVLQKPREKHQGGVVIALSSSNPGEGVTYVARALVHELAQCELTSVAGINVSFLKKLHEPTVEAIRSSVMRQTRRTAEGSNGDESKAPSTVVQRSGPWEANWQYRRDCIELLRSEFDYTIIDCPSLKESGDVLSISPFIDGIVLIVEANRTRRGQPHQAEQRIAAAGGTLLGYVLNKRVYEVPRWLLPDA